MEEWMRCPTLSELPSPPAGRSGWPWTEESPQLPDTLPDGRPYPKITVVTPSYNQGQFIEETIRAVLLQGYPNLEYIITDGGSKDGSVEIIRKYGPWLSYWVSEADRGQSHAINKGLERATGDILAFINSDDVYLRDSFASVSAKADPARAQLLFGDVGVIEGLNWEPMKLLSKKHLGRKEILFGGTPLSQPSSFWTKQLWDQVGPFNESLHYTMDYEMTLRMLAARAEFIYVPCALSVERRHDDQKTASKNKDALYQEKAQVRFAIARAMGMNKWSYLIRSLLFHRARLPMRLYKWRALTLQEKLLVAASMNKKLSPIINRFGQSNAEQTSGR
jgi:glycosyltransferase involved in cell wall biosynthesis